MIPEGREAWSDHCLHTERVHTDRRRCTISVALRHRDFIKNMTIGALQADMTLIMVCVITRQTVQRETTVRVTGDVKVKLSTTYERCVPLPVEAWLPKAISTASRGPPVQSQTASTQQAKAQSGAAVPKQSSHAGREPRKNILQRFPSLHRASPQLPSPVRELESLTTNPTNKSQTTAPLAARAIERL